MKILILGIMGMLGYQVYIKFKKSKIFSSVRGTIRQSKESIKKYYFFDVNDIYDNIDFDSDGFERLYNIINEYKPDVVINCIVIKKSDNKKEFLLINSFLPHFIARIISKKSKLIQISTDGIFSGNKGDYSETDKPDPIGIYAESKLFGEVAYGNNLTIRASIFGHEISDKKSGLVEWFLNNTNREVKGFSNYYFSGISTNFLSKILIDLIKLNVSGIINICSDKISKYEFLTVLNDIYSYKKDIVKSYNEKTDRSLNPTKMIERLKINPPNIKDMISKMKEELYECKRFM